MSRITAGFPESFVALQILERFRARFFFGSHSGE